MRNKSGPFRAVTLSLIAAGFMLLTRSAGAQGRSTSPTRRPSDAVADAQTPQAVPVERPEQRKTAHDQSDIFAPSKAEPSSEALADQPDHGGMIGFDLAGPEFRRALPDSLGEQAQRYGQAAEAPREPL